MISKTGIHVALGLALVSTALVAGPTQAAAFHFVAPQVAPPEPSSECRTDSQCLRPVKPTRSGHEHADAGKAYRGVPAGARCHDGRASTGQGRSAGRVALGRIKPEPPKDTDGRRRQAFAKTLEVCGKDREVVIDASYVLADDGRLSRPAVEVTPDDPKVEACVLKLAKEKFRLLPPKGGARASFVPLRVKL